MKIVFTRNVHVDFEIPRLEEVWPKYVFKNQTFNVDQIEDITDASVNVVLVSGEVLLEVPKNSFQTFKPVVSFETFT